MSGAGGARTHDRRIMRSTASCTMPASCTNDTGHRIDGTHCSGIIGRAGPRTGPRLRRLYLLILLLCVTSMRRLYPRSSLARLHHVADAPRRSRRLWRPSSAGVAGECGPAGSGARRCRAGLPASTLEKMAPKIATSNDPPMERKNVAPELGRRALIADGRDSRRRQELHDDRPKGNRPRAVRPRLPERRRRGPSRADSSSFDLNDARTCREPADRRKSSRSGDAGSPDGT
jgi:hypothetical protein